MKFLKEINWKEMAVCAVALFVALALYNASGADSAITEWRAKTKA